MRSILADARLIEQAHGEGALLDLSSPEVTVWINNGRIPPAMLANAAAYTRLAETRSVSGRFC